MIRIAFYWNTRDPWRRVDLFRPIISRASRVLRRDAEIACTFVDARTSRTWNARYRGKHHPANVLSVGWDSPEGIAGDILLCPAVIRRESRKFGMSFARRASHLFIHGILHCYGYDHQSLYQQKRMESREVYCLGYNPYV